MALAEIFKAIQGQIADVLSATGGKVPNFGFGKEGVPQSSAPPRIVFIPVAGPASPPDSRGGETRALWKRKVHVEFHVWERDISAAEALCNHLVAAIHFVMPGSYAMVGEAWDTDGISHFGLLCVLTAQL